MGMKGDTAKPAAAKADYGRPSHCDIRGATSIYDAILKPQHICTEGSSGFAF